MNASVLSHGAHFPRIIPHQNATVSITASTLQLLACVPLSRGRVDFAVHFLGTDGLGVESTVLVSDSGRFIQRHTQAPESWGMQRR